jgi:hypothetical protein
MKRGHTCLVASVVLLTLIPWNVAEAQTFKNCAAVKAKYPNGVAINFAVVGTSGAEINRVVYLRNQRLDRDKDGLICEDEWAQSIGNTTTTTTTTVPVTRRTPVSNLSAFVRTYGAAVTTIECRSDGYIDAGSGTSILMRPVKVDDREFRSTLVTNHHVVESCLSGNWLNRQVLVRAGTIECVGYVWTWAYDVDLAAVYTTCDIPKVSGFTGTVVPKPEIGDVAITIGSAAGVAGTSTQGAIANITKDEILTTAQAATDSSGAALFNRDGQLLGIVQRATGTLTVVIPITKFPGIAYPASDTIAWRT